jgi:hypothetical protein
MKLPRLAFLAALFGACSAAASPAGDIGGTWECRQPGVQYHNKPPILYVSDSGGAQGAVDVDGFSREVYGRSEIAPEDGGWWRVKPAQGPEFLIRPDAGTGAKGTPSMGLRRTGDAADYRCLRLPPTGTPALPPSGVQSVLQPAGEQGAPAPEAPGAATPETAMPETQGAPPVEPPSESSPAPKAD